MNNDNLTTERPVIWEEKNSIGPEKKSENSGVLDGCDITINTKELRENEPLIGITKEKKKISGIYKIVNKVNGKYYVGSSKNICNNWCSRWNNHVKRLNNNRHYNNYLQKAWNKYGKNNFDFIIIEEVDDDDKLLIIEQKYLNIAKNEQNKCYNLKFKAGGGGEFSEYSIKKLSIYMKGKRYFLGKHHTEEAKEKIGKYHKLNSIRENNSKYKKEKFLFKNKYTNEMFYGTRNDLYKTFNLRRSNVSQLVLGKANEVKGWKVIK